MMHNVSLDLYNHACMIIKPIASPKSTLNEDYLIVDRSAFMVSLDQSHNLVVY